MDAMDDRLFWSLFLLVVLAATWLALWVFTRFIDRTNPLTRADRRHLRSVTSGKRAMAGFKSRATQ